MTTEYPPVPPVDVHTVPPSTITGEVDATVPTAIPVAVRSIFVNPVINERKEERKEEEFSVYNKIERVANKIGNIANNIMNFFVLENDNDHLLRSAIVGVGVSIVSYKFNLMDRHFDCSIFCEHNVRKILSRCSYTYMFYASLWLSRYDRNKDVRIGVTFINGIFIYTMLNKMGMPKINLPSLISNQDKNQIKNMSKDIKGITSHIGEMNYKLADLTNKIDSLKH